jgi:hypothetical protein
MHKKKNSASVLAGEMIITFYKPPTFPDRQVSPRRNAIGDPAAILTEVLDVCLSNGTKAFTTEALYNRLILELWHRRALRCLTLNRREFVSRLEQRGWTYNSHTHLWSTGESKVGTTGEAMLFGS